MLPQIKSTRLHVAESCSSTLPGRSKVFPGLGCMIILLILVANTRLDAQITVSTSNTAVIAESSQEALPPKPAALAQVPVARIETDMDGPYSRPMASYLVSLFGRAGRPRMTEGDNFNYVIRASILTPPTMSFVKSGGGKFNPLKAAKSVGQIFGAPKVPDIPENLNLDNTNLVVEVSCGVELRLLNKQKDILEQRSVQVVRTNSLRALSAELNGFATGSNSADVESFMRNLTKSAVFQALVNLAAYHASTNLLTAADARFIEAGTLPEPTAVTQPQPVSQVTPPTAISATITRGAFCSQCGAKMTADAKFCAGCGTKIAP